MNSRHPIFNRFLVVLQAPYMAIAVVVMAASTFVYTWLYYPITQGHGGDFIAMLSHREVDYGYWDGHGLGYGPIFALYDLALRGFSDIAAMRLMFAVNLAMLALAFVVVMQRFLPAPRTRTENVAAIFLWVCFYPTFQALRQNNVEITELLFLALMLAALRRRNDWLAGICLGIAGATKILPFVLIVYFLWRRRLRVVGASILTGVSLLYLVLVLKSESLVASVQAWLNYATQPYPVVAQTNQAISGLVWRAFSQFDLTSRAGIELPLVLNANSAQVVTLYVTIILFVIVAAIVLRSTGLLPRQTTDNRTESVEVAIVLTMLLVLISHNHTHYFILIAWVFIASLREWPQPTGTKGRWASALMYLSYAMLGLLLVWRLFDFALRPLGPVTGIDVVRLASLPLMGALAGLAALLLVHSDLVGYPSPPKQETS